MIPAEYEEYKVYSVGNIEASSASTESYNIFGETNSLTNTTIKSITISEGIEVIETAAFNECTGLTGNLILPESLKNIGAGAFYGCTGLTGDLIIPEGVTAIEASTFRECKGLNGTVTFPSTLETIGYASFYKCSNITGNLVIPEGVTLIDDFAFRECIGLNGTVTFPSTLETIGYASFYKCSNITGNLVIPEGVTLIDDYSFSYCSKLNGTLTLPTGLKDIGMLAFNSCSKLTGDLIIPEGVTTIGKAAFQNCGGFNGKLILPSTLERIESYAFNHCSGFTNKTLTIPKSAKMIGANETDASHVFYDFATKTIEEYIVEEGSEYFKSLDGVLLNKAGTRIVAYPANKVGNTYEIPEGVTIIDELAFNRAGSGYSSVPETGLKKLILPNSYILTTTLPDEYINSGNNLAVGLYSYTGVNEIKVKEDNPNYKTVDGILYSKDGTVLWYVPIAKTGEIKILDGVTTIKDGAFFEYRSHTVTIPASVTEIGSKALSELKSMGKSKVIFEEGSIFEFKSNGTIGKK